MKQTTHPVVMHVNVNDGQCSTQPVTYKARCENLQEAQLLL